MPFRGQDCSELEGSFEEWAEVWASSSELDDQGKWTFLSEKDLSAVLTFRRCSLLRETPTVESELESLSSDAVFWRSNISVNKTEDCWDNESIVSGGKMKDTSSVDIVDASFPVNMFGEACDFGEICRDITGPRSEGGDNEVYPMPDGSLMV